MTVKLTDVREPLNVLYYGDGGTGKTTALATMANLGPVLIVNAESGVKRRPLEAMGVNVANIELFPGPGQAISPDDLESEWARVKAALNENPDAYAGVIWDSVTEIYKALLESIVSEAAAQAERQGRERNRFFISRDDYGLMTEQMRRLVRKYRDLPCHFGVSALARRETDDDGAVVYQPAVTPALQNDLVGWMDIVTWTSIVASNGTDEYRGLFGPHGKYRGKDRLGAVPKWLVDPTFERIAQYTDGTLTTSKDPVMEAARKRAKASEAQSSADKKESK